MDSQQEVILLKMLKEMQRLIYSENCAKVIESIRDLDIVIFLGNTRSGKSTIVNYVIGNSLKAIKCKKLYKITKENENNKGPVIGMGSASETTVPTSWTSTKINGAIVDAPGFDDNRGESQDVANSFYIKELITNARSVKFVLISDLNDIMNDNITQFTNFIDKIYIMLPQNDIMRTGMSVVFSKDRYETTRKEICQYFDEKILQQPRMKINNRGLIKHFVKNPHQIVIVNMPEKQGILDEKEVFSDLVEVIENKISMLPKELLENITPGLSDRSKCFLLEAHTYFSEFRELDEVLKAVEVSFYSRIKQFDANEQSLSSDSLATMKNEIVNIEGKIEYLVVTHMDLSERLQSLSEFVPDVTSVHPGSIVYMKLKFIRFVDQILQIEESNMFTMKVISCLSKMRDKLNEYRIKLQQKMHEITMEEAAERIRKLEESKLKEQIAHYEKINELQRKQLEVLQQQRENNQSRGFCVVQ